MLTLSLAAIPYKSLSLLRGCGACNNCYKINILWLSGKVKKFCYIFAFFLIGQFSKNMNLYEKKNEQTCSEKDLEYLHKALMSDNYESNDHYCSFSSGTRAASKRYGNAPSVTALWITCVICPKDGRDVTSGWRNRPGSIKARAVEPASVGMGDTSYFIFNPIPIFSSPLSSIPIPVN